MTKIWVAACGAMICVSASGCGQNQQPGPPIVASFDWDAITAQANSDNAVGPGVSGALFTADSTRKTSPVFVTTSSPVYDGVTYRGLVVYRDSVDLAEVALHGELGRAMLRITCRLPVCLEIAKGHPTRLAIEDDGGARLQLKQEMDKAIIDLAPGSYQIRIIATSD